MSYLADLTLRLAAGAARLPEDVCRRHAEYVLGRQHVDGGFSGRRGPGDLYYTSFAMRTLAMVNRLDEATCGRVAGFLGGRLAQPLPSIDFLSLVTAAVLVEGATGVDVFAETGRDLQGSVADSLERFRRGDGGYAKTQRGGQGSTYHTFLAAGCRELVGLPPDGAPQMIELVRSRRRADGGFVEISPMPYSGSNPTAAAVGLLRMLDALDQPTAAAAAEFLAAMQTGEGGLRANTRIPVADLLSTFTGVVALGDLGALSAIDTAAVRRFVQSLDRPGGGFRAGGFDDAVDVEYTFYGLGTLALLSPG